jgi:hypothetical protein
MFGRKIIAELAEIAQDLVRSPLTLASIREANSAWVLRPSPREHWLSPCLHPLLPADVLIWGSGAHVSDSRKWHRSAMGKYNIAHGRLEQNTNTDVKTELPDSR